MRASASSSSKWSFSSLTHGKGTKNNRSRSVCNNVGSTWFHAILLRPNAEVQIQMPEGLLRHGPERFGYLTGFPASLAYANASEWQTRSEAQRKGVLFVHRVISMPLATILIKSYKVLQPWCCSNATGNFIATSCCLIATSHRHIRGSFGPSLARLPLQVVVASLFLSLQPLLQR